MPILIFFAFLAGVITVLSPCILPILPVVLSGSLGEGKKRPLGVVTGFVASFTFFTLALSTIVKATGLPSDFLRNLAVVVIILFGISLLIPQTQLLLEKLFSKLSNFVPRTGNSTGFGGGFLVGLSLGLLWAPCVGPILASVITLAVTSSVTFAAVLITLAYAVGTAIPMLAITYGGRQLLQKNRWLLEKSAAIQRGFGVVMIVIGVGMFLQLDRSFQSYLLEKFPQYGAGLTALENNTLVQKQLQLLGGEPGELTEPTAELLPARTKAPGFSGGGPWINSQPLSLEKDLQGKVVLVDFWTYSCINCIRTFPYLRQWYDTYKDKGFVIVGVHSPEFEFEKKTENVQQAVKDFELTYPVVQDNDFDIWTSYKNRFWPAHYLIDKNGYIRYTHFGEGNYDTTEAAIRELLGEEMVQDTPMTSLTQSQPNPVVSSRQQTPEIYLGWERAQHYTFENSVQRDKAVSYALKYPLSEDEVGLQGSWKVEGENVQAEEDDARLLVDFFAKDVYLVMDAEESTNKKVTIFLDGKQVTAEQATGDMINPGTISVQEARKYDIVTLPKAERHVLEIHVPKGMKLFAFTFGS